MSRQTFRVAVIVFCECEGVDYIDASHGAELSLNQILREGGLKGDYKVLPSPTRRDGMTWETKVYQVMDAGTAVGNGYMWLSPTGRAYPREEEPQENDN